MDKKQHAKDLSFECWLALVCFKDTSVGCKNIWAYSILSDDVVIDVGITR
jgi:hypothetical protein